LTPQGKGTHAPRTPWAPSKSPPADESQESQPEATPAVKPLQLFDTGADDEKNCAGARKTPSKGLTAIEQAQVVETTISERAMMNPESRKRVILHILVIYYFTVIYCKFVGMQMKLVNTFTFHLNM